MLLPKEGISQGLKPSFVVGCNARAKALAYLEATTVAAKAKFIVEIARGSLMHDRAGLQPFGLFIGLDTWGDAPGWYSDGPLALWDSSASAGEAA